MINETDSSESDINNSQDYDETEENIIQVLVTTDINLGYEQTVKRDQEDDSFRTFEEILKYATDYDVDVILLGGNLFYEANPPLNVITRCISLLRKYCLSEKCTKIDCITDPEWIFGHCPHKVVNFKDPNLNIGLPIFSIYGHRDAPIFGPTGPLDLLAATGLINYFGKWTNNTEITIPPLLLRKGITTLALYGLNHMSDAKLSKIMKNNKLEILQEDSISNVCNVMILHQNRARRNRPKNMYIPENLLPNFLNLVLWGHEPVCRIEHKSVPRKSFHISQPGSTIATSLTQGETIPKKVAILKVYKDKFLMKYLRLKTVRPFVYKRLDINEHNDEISNLQRRTAFGRLSLSLRSRAEAIEEFVNNYIKNVMLPEAQKLETGHPDQPKKPLLRLKIVHNQEKDEFSLFRLSRKYETTIANPSEMIVFSNTSLLVDDLDSDVDDDYEDLSTIFFQDQTQGWTRTIEGTMTEYFNRPENRDKLKVLSLDNLNEALIQFKNNDKKAFERVVRMEMQEVVNHLLSADVELEDAIEAIQSFREEVLLIEESE